MKLIAGLGNPGTRYARTRHNAGFLVIDELCRRHGLTMKPAKGNWYESHTVINNEEVLLMKPSSYMNNSGLAVRDCVEKNVIDLKDLFVVVDDFQIPLGTIRVRKRGSDGGHNGLASISYELGTEEYARMRVGIGKGDVMRKEEYVDFVLGEFGEDEIAKLEKLYGIYADCAESFVCNGVARTMNSFNKSYLEDDKDTGQEADQKI